MIPANITTRETSGTGASNKGSPLTNAELDNNFININDSLVELQGLVGGGGIELSKMRVNQLFGGGATIADSTLLSNGANVVMYYTSNANLTLELDSGYWDPASLYNNLNTANNSNPSNPHHSYMILVYVINRGPSPMTITWNSNNTFWTKVYPGGTPPAGPAAGQVNAYLLHYTVSSESMSFYPAGLSNNSVFIYPVATNLVGAM